jgi:hypothetical protein
MADQNKHPDKISLFSLIQSTAAAAFGVQTQKNRERDFSQGKPHVFIIAGLIFVLVFVLSVYTVVQMVLP